MSFHKPYVRIIATGERVLKVAEEFTIENVKAICEEEYDKVVFEGSGWVDSDQVDLFKDKVHKADITSYVDMDISFLKKLSSLVSLRFMYFTSALPSQVIDFRWFPVLEECDLGWHKCFSPNLFEVASLKRLTLKQFKDKNFSTIGRAQNLEYLELIQCTIPTLNGIENMAFLAKLDFQLMPKLVDISSISLLSKTLKKLVIGDCKNIIDYSPISSLHNLEVFVMGGNFEVAHIDFVNNLHNLRELSIGYKVTNLDLDMIFKLPNIEQLHLFDMPNITQTDDDLHSMAAKYNKEIVIEWIRIGKKEKTVRINFKQCL